MKVSSLKIIPVPMYSCTLKHKHLKTNYNTKITKKAELLTEVKRQRVDCKSMCFSYVAECFSRNT